MMPNAVAVSGGFRFPGLRSVHRSRRSPLHHTEPLEDRTLLSTYTVTTLTDSTDDGSLRAAITAANAAPGADTIEFDSTLTGTLNLTLGELAITDSLAINGPGTARLAISGLNPADNSRTRVFDITAAGAIVKLTGLTIRDGQASTGGGILNAGSLTLLNVVVSGNTATNTTPDAGGLVPGGGGILNTGILVLAGSHVTGNTSAGNGAGLQNYAIDGPAVAKILASSIDNNTAADSGGGIQNASSAARASMALGNSTIAANAAADAAGFSNVAAAGQTAPVTFINCTVAWNSASGDTGGIANSQGAIAIGNSLVVGNSAATNPDVSGHFVSRGSNIIGKSTGSTGWTRLDRAGTLARPLNARIAPLDNYGGASQTVALLPGSIAINHANPALLRLIPPAYRQIDQRGLARIRGAAADIGAYESDQDLVVNTGSTSSALGDLGLIAAVNIANLNRNPDAISFASGLSDITLATTAPLPINTPITIAGTAAHPVYVHGAHGVFAVAANTTFTLQDMVISGQLGAGQTSGGAVSNAGTLIARRVSFVNCQANISGGAIYNTGYARVDACSFFNNAISSITGEHGGAIYNAAGARVFVTGSTFGGNLAVSSSGLITGGAIYSDGVLQVINTILQANQSDTGGAIDAANLIMLSCTVTGNTARLGAASGLNIRSGATIGNSILATNGADPQPPNVAGDIRSLGHNLVGNADGSTGWIATDLLGDSTTNMDPMFDVSAAPLPGSPAINGGDNKLITRIWFGRNPVDQKGNPRIAGGTVDIGAIELTPSPLLITGTADADVITLSATGNTISWQINSADVQTADARLVSRIVVNALAGNDRVDGSGFNLNIPIRINGGDGNDTLIGGAGNDVLVGNAGRDALYGNAGNDLFATRDGEVDGLNGGPGTDSARADRTDRLFLIERVLA